VNDVVAERAKLADHAAHAAHAAGRTVDQDKREASEAGKAVQTEHVDVAEPKKTIRSPKAVNGRSVLNERLASTDAIGLACF
jgi:chorismate mutase